jgi:hypothetical protein
VESQGVIVEVEELVESGSESDEGRRKKGAESPRSTKRRGEAKVMEARARDREEKPATATATAKAQSRCEARKQHSPLFLTRRKKKGRMRKRTLSSPRPPITKVSLPPL